jgi:hypothetical protein
MKKIILILFLIIFSANVSFASEPDYRQIYMDLEVPTFSYIHGIDPGQYYDNQNATYTPYPLFRLTSPIYFKTISVQPGYFLLTPITYKGNPYLLFKECGIIKYTIPVYNKELVPEGFYESHIPQPRLTTRQKMSKNFYHFIGTHFKTAQKKPAVKTYLEVNDLDNKFVSLIVYYGPYRYYTIFRTVQF